MTGTITTRAANDGAVTPTDSRAARTFGGFCPRPGSRGVRGIGPLGDAVLITDGPQPAAAAVVRAPGRDRRLDPPGLRQRLPGERAPRASNPQEGRQAACAPVPGADALPGCALPPSQPHG